MKHSNKITAPLSQGEVLSLQGSEATKAKQGKSTTSQTTTPSLRDSARKREIVAIHTLARHCETSQRLGVAIHESKIDCHESANADSRNDDFPNLPKSWQVKTLGEVCDIIMGQSPLGEKVIDKSQNTDSKALEFHQGKICFTDKFISESEVVTTDIRKIAPKDSILLCVRAPVGVVNITQRRIAIGRGLCALNLKDSSNDFLYFYLLTLNNYFNQKATGSTFSAINLDTIKNTKIPIPPLEIQRRIVKRLDEAFSRSENGTKHLKSAKDNLTKYKQSLLKSAFNGALTQDCPLSLGESTAESSLRENPQGFSWQSTHSLSQGESANLPQDWTIKTLGEVCEKISAGGDRPNDCTAEKTQENQIPIFSNGIENNGLYGYTKTPTITKPALTISARGTIGFVCVRYEPFFPIVRLICAIPNDKVLVLEFLAYALRYLIPQGEGSSIPQLTIPNFKQIKIPIPPLEIQKQIVAILERHFTSADKVSAYIDSCLSKAKQLKSSLLKSAFAGEFV